MKVLIVVCLWVQAAFSLPNTTIDRVKIHHAYREGDFDAVRKQMRRFYGNPKFAYSQEDSLFMATHGAAVLWSSPPTRDSARVLMRTAWRLSFFVPGFELESLYASDSLRSEFLAAKVEAEAMAKTNVLHPKPSSDSSNAQGEPPPSPVPAGWKPSRPFIATTTIAVLAIGATAAYFWMHSGKPEPEIIRIPNHTDKGESK
jgi:hypothetical protein